MKSLFTLGLCLAMTCNALAADNDYKVMYDGGSVGGLKAGNKAEIHLETKQIRLVREGRDVVDIPASTVTEITYGEDAHRRVGAAIGLAVVSFGAGALMALTKSKKHFVGLTWADGDIKGGFAIQCDKNDYRGLLTGLEGITGKKAVDSTSLTVNN